MEYVHAWSNNIQQEQFWVSMLNMWCEPNIADAHTVFAMCILLAIKDFTAKK